MIFYGVYIKNQDLGFLFDALRFIAQPDALRRAHITVRGPYERRIDIEQFNQNPLGDLAITKPGHFFFNQQQTVFLHCEIVGIWDVWKKPDIRNGVVHLTVYDGNNKEESREIFNIIQHYPWNIWTQPTPLVELEKKTVNTEAINILEPDFSRRFMDLFEKTFDISRVRRFSFLERKDMIKVIIDRIHDKYGPKSLKNSRR